MANCYAFIVLALLATFYACQSSLLKDTLRKGGIRDENDGINVEVVNEDNKVKETTEDDKVKETAEDNKVKETAEDSKEEKDKADEGKNAKIEMVSMYRPSECENTTKSGKVAVVHYTGWLGDKKFDSTIDPLKRYAPFEFLVGTGAVIKGFEQGLKGMCKGERRKIVIPPELGYGTKGAGLIPGNSTITYDVELLDVRDPPPQADVFGAMDNDGDKKLTREEVGEYMKKQSQLYYGAPVEDEYWKHYHDQMVENIFSQEDEDEDGHISHDEFSGPKLHHEEL